MLLNPPFLEKFSRSSRSPAVSKGGCIYFPIWLSYATGVLEKNGFEAKLVDAPAESKNFEEVKKIAIDFKPELIIIDTSTPSIVSDSNIAIELKKEFPESFVIMVGAHASAMPEQTLRLSNADAVARHEYDYIVRDVAIALRDKKDWKKVLGITYRNSDGKICSNADMQFIENLDELPFVSQVYKKHLNIKNYFYPSVLFPEVTIITGRGCPNYCTFCVLPQVMNGHRYRVRSIENVVEEIAWIKKNLPEIKDIMIEDDTFTADKQRVKDFAGELKKRKLKINYTVNARADVDYETLKAMKESGCRLMCIGFESAEQQILNNIKKGTIVERIKQFRRDAKKAGILTHGCFILGNRGETIETIEKTVKMALELNPDTAQFFPIMVYPGTEDYEWFKKNGFLLTEDFEKWLLPDGSHNTIISTNNLSAETLVEKCNEARIRFYLRPKYIAKKIAQLIANPQDIPRTIKAGRVFLKYLFKKKKTISPNPKKLKAIGQ